MEARKLQANDPEKRRGRRDPVDLDPKFLEDIADNKPWDNDNGSGRN